MRFTRLKRQIQDGTLMRPHAGSFQSEVDKLADSLGKRKAISEESTAGKRRKRDTKFKIKTELEGTSDDNETDSSEYMDSEDEMPLAKRQVEKPRIDGPRSVSS